MSCGCNRAPAATVPDGIGGETLVVPTGTRCDQFAAQKRAFLQANPTRNPGLRPRRVSSFVKPDPCNPVQDALSLNIQERLDGIGGLGSEQNCICRVPSLFVANNAREAEALSFTYGWVNQLADPEYAQGGGPRTLGLGGSASKTFGQLSTKAINFLQRPQTFCRQPSVFTCDDGRCQSALDYQLGFTTGPNDQENRNLNSGFTKGLGGGRGPGNKTYEQQAVRVTRFGNANAGF